MLAGPLTSASSLIRPWQVGTGEDVHREGTRQKLRPRAVAPRVIRPTRLAGASNVNPSSDAQRLVGGQGLRLEGREAAHPVGPGRRRLAALPTRTAGSTPARSPPPSGARASRTSS